MSNQPIHFNYKTLPNHVLFGHGRLAEIKQIAKEMGSARALILTTPRQKPLLGEQIAQLLGDLAVGVYPHAVQHVPRKVVTDAVNVATAKNADLLIAPGGGSTIGLAKGIALETGLPILAVPTTYAGSEMTHIWGISQDGRKTTGRDPIVKPRTVIYDPELIATLPPAVSLTSGINAMAHAVEALYAENANPIASMMAEESIRQLAASLPAVMQDPTDKNARATSMYGAWLAASVLDTVGMALHHKLCHTLGGSYGLPHAQTHTVVLPYAVAYNHSHAPQAMAAIGRALHCNIGDVAGTLQDISRHNGGPTSLKELGFKEQDIAEAAEIAVQKPYYNPRSVTKQGVFQLLTEAYHGLRPTQQSTKLNL